MKKKISTLHNGTITICNMQIENRIAYCKPYMQIVSRIARGRCPLRFWSIDCSSIKLFYNVYSATIYLCSCALFIL